MALIECDGIRNYLKVFAYNHLQYNHVDLYSSPIKLTISTFFIDFFKPFLKLFSCGNEKAAICLHKRNLKINTDSSNPSQSSFISISK